jgi:hypothetical protein
VVFPGVSRGAEFPSFGVEIFGAPECDFTEEKNEKNTNPNLIDFGT